MGDSRWQIRAGWSVIILFFLGGQGCIAPPADPQNAGNTSAKPKRTADVSGDEMLFEDFDGSPINGGWFAAYDTNGLGTTFNPTPFKLADEGCPKSPKRSAHMWGTLGADTAPWSWAQIGLPTTGPTMDLTKWKTVRFWAKGSPGSYIMIIARGAVKDNDHYHMKFEVTDKWQEISLPLDRFRQFGWGQKRARVFDDVVNLMFTSKRHGDSFDLYVDHITFSTRPMETKDHPYDTADWFAYKGVDVAKRKGTALDVSYLLDAPAGKHGWVKARGENFVFEDGVPARFWGVNIVASANFPSHADAEKTAELLAQMGVNMTRHHHYDAPWTNLNMFGNNGQTREFDTEAMDRFDYFIAQLQKRGIYQYMDLLVHRAPYAKDGISDVSGLVNGYKIEGEFAPELIGLQKEFTAKFLAHKNPYTGKTYGTDPAFCLMEIINEDSLFYIQKSGDFAVESPGYIKMLDQRFTNWLKKRYSSQEALRTAWSSDDPARKGLLSAEQFEQGNISGVLAFGDGDEQTVSVQRAKDTFAFYYELTRDYYSQIREVVRASGSRALVTGSNHWVTTPIDLYINSEFDYVDRHQYWSHPQGGWNLDMVTHDNTPMVKNATYGLVGLLANRRVADKPYIITEWQSAAPNDYRQDANFAMGAYAAYQNWSGLQFAYAHDNQTLDPMVQKPLYELFNILEQPVMAASWPAVALMYHRQDVTRGEKTVVMPITKAAVFDPETRNGLSGRVGLAHKTGVKFVEERAMGGLTPPVAPQGDRVVNDTGELTHDKAAGLFTVNTRRTQGAAFMKRDKPIELGDVSIFAHNPFAVVVVSALAKKPITEAQNILVTAIGNMANTGMVRDFSGDRISVNGDLPILLEPIAGQIVVRHLTGDLAGVKVYALDDSGQRKGEVPVTVADERLSFEMAAAHQTLYYEIVRP